MLKIIKYYIPYFQMFCCVEKKYDFCNPFSERKKSLDTLKRI